jgi:hypothetical protein
LASLLPFSAFARHATDPVFLEQSFVLALWGDHLDAPSPTAVLATAGDAASALLLAAEMMHPVRVQLAGRLFGTERVAQRPLALDIPIDLNN